MNFRLPEKYHAKHELCFLLLDFIANIFSEYEISEFFFTKFPLTTENDKYLFDNGDGDSLSADQWKWLSENGHVDEVTFKIITPAIVSDFLYFVYTALECSAKGEMSVVYSLCRKPFNDNLFYLEYLASDQSGFLQAFYKSPKNIDVVERTEFERKKIIANTLDKIQNEFPDSIAPLIFDVDFMYDIRYNKDCQCGFQKEWNTATHLITTHKKWTTEPMNFNFIFVGETEQESLWNHLYNKLPLLLMYTAEVLLVILNRIHPLNPKSTKDLYEICVAGIYMLSIEAGFDWDKFISEEIEKELKTTDITGIVSTDIKVRDFTDEE